MHDTLCKLLLLNTIHCMSLTLRWLSFLIAIYHVAWSQWYWKELTHLYCLSVNLPCILCIGNIILAIWHCSAINWIIVKVNVFVLVCVCGIVSFLHHIVLHITWCKNDTIPHTHTCTYTLTLTIIQFIALQCLQCFDAVGWATGRASGL